MKVLLETTVWTDATPNHIYFTYDSKDKMYAYIKRNTIDIFRFKKPIKFSISHRKFQEIPNTFGYTIDDRPEGQTWTVAGSRGDSYTVSKNNSEWVCTCAGFKFRGACKHVTELSATY
jgi:hypothetical protein